MLLFLQTITSVPLSWYIFLSIALFSIGVVGVLYRRNAITLIMAVELMINSVNLLMTAFAAYSGNAEGQMLVFFIMVVAAAEVTVGLALIVLMYRNMGAADITLFNQMKG